MLESIPCLKSSYYTCGQHPIQPTVALIDIISSRKTPQQEAADCRMYAYVCVDEQPHTVNLEASSVQIGRMIIANCESVDATLTLAVVGM